MRFSLTTLLWLFALLASALVAFDGWGLLAAAAVAVFWVCLHRNPSGTATGCVWVAIGAFIMLLLLPAVNESRSYSRTGHCMNNIRQVGLALEYYDTQHGALPPASMQNHAGLPLHSWRSLVLHNIERADLFDALRWEEPWDSANNKQAASSPVDLYTCPSHSTYSTQPETNYFVVTGPGTLWPPEGPRSLSDIRDGAENTVMLIEGDTAIPWAKPADLTVTEAVALLTSPDNPPAVAGHVSDPGYFYLPATVRHVVMADGRVLGIECPISRELAIALLTVDGGEEVDFNEINRHVEPRLDWRRCGGLAFFVLASLAPALSPTRRWLKGELAHALRGGTG
ncbi:hypothetical protein KOR34_22070 [Posidoniimonas corsicana]|uniref:DUF1559 domain-containing protein n=1 Tax=Posidoniimonas corsicana TaxID=1938618 RepID=A0A5C5VH30_9BACT|nr:DUF1559 domain-containing protein [Posidoniimonas corsicana]TWT37260.1 hypothetical protein KOR34_22070 [Posidoniimonas corsicana]